MGVRKAQWKTDTQFDYGTPLKEGVEVVGADDDAYIALIDNGNSAASVPFDEPSNYTYDPAETAIVGGRARLANLAGAEEVWPFDEPANYSYDSNKVAIDGGTAKLLGVGGVYAQWKLNETAGMIAADSSGNGRDGTLLNMENEDWKAGKLNNCLEFGGTNECIDCEQIAAFDRFDAFSVDFWMKSSASGVTMGITGKQTTAGVGWLVYITSANQLRFIMAYSAASRFYVTAPGAANDGTWHHWAVTYDGSSDANGVHVYRDNVNLTFSIEQNTLTDSILSSAACSHGSRDLAWWHFVGQLDEIVYYEKELTASQVAFRWNAGAGTEDAVFATDHPTITPMSGFPFTAALNSFVEAAEKPGATEIHYQLSADDGVTWKWWNGSAWMMITGAQTNTWYYENESNPAAEVADNIESLASSGTLRWRVFLHTDGVSTPEIDQLQASYPLSYVVGQYQIEMNWDLHPTVVADWLGVDTTANEPEGTSVRYQYSMDSGTSYNGTWLTASELSTEIVSLVAAKDGTDKLRLKFQLGTTDNSVTPELFNVDVNFWIGYASSGSYISTQYVPITSATWPGNENGCYVGRILFDVNQPDGTSIVIQARAIDSVLEQSYTEYSTGDLVGICGYIIQWMAELLTNDPAITPRVNSVEIEFHVLIGIMRTLEQYFSGRARIDASAKQLIVYEGDGITPLATFDLLDEQGNPNALRPFERRPV